MKFKGDDSYDKEQYSMDAETVVDSIEITNDPEEESNNDQAGAKPKKRWIKKLIICLVLVGVIGLGCIWLFGKSNSQASTDIDYSYYTVSRQDITEILSGSGTLEAADSYTVTTLLSGEIVSAPFEEGAVVAKDAVLYKIDSSDLSSNIEKAQISLNQSQRNYNNTVKNQKDLKIYADDSGYLVALDVEVGDDIKSGEQIASIRDSSTMSITFLYNSTFAESFYVGQQMEITLLGYYQNVNGTISSIGAIDKVVDGGILREIEVEVSNPGAIVPGQEAYATINGMMSDSSTFAYRNESIITSKVAGTISQILVSEGDFISDDQLLVVLESDSLDDDIQSASDSIRNAQISLNNQYDQLDSYTIKSPIAGTIIEKNYKVGDTMDDGKVLCTIFDLSYLTMTLNIDELDISKISVGQSVTITAEAVEGKTYEGVVTKVNINGTTSNGVTSYPVTVRIDETDGLLPGMNVDAEILVASSENVLAIPVGAVSRGNMVLVQSGADSSQPLDGAEGGPSGDEVIPNDIQGQRPAPDGEALPSGDLPEGLTEGNMPDNQSGSANPNVTADSTNSIDGFNRVRVSLGLSNGEYIEVKEGLSEGDVIAYIEDVTTTTQDINMNMMGGGGTMIVTNGGGMPPDGGGNMGGGGPR